MTESDSTHSRTNFWPVFICYRQSDGRAVAERVFALLDGCVVPAAAGDEAPEDLSRLDIYFDQAAPGIGDWTTLHEPYLKRARAFVVVCTPGAKLVEGDDDWVHREINWWIQNRQEPPILIDALGEEERYVPKAIADKWPKAQRIKILLEDWRHSNREELATLEQRARARILGGITRSAGNIYRQELLLEQQRSKQLSDALTTQRKLATSLQRSSIALAVFFLFALGIAAYANRLRSIADDRRISALSGKLAAISRALVDESHFQLETAILLAVEGLRRRPNPQLMDVAQQMLASVLKRLPGFSDATSAEALAVSPDGSLIATAEAEGNYMVISVRTVPSDREIARTKLPKQFTLFQLSFDPPMKHLIIVGAEDAWIWDWTTQIPFFLPHLGQREIIVNRAGRWLAGLNEEGIQIYDLKGEYTHRVLPAGKSPWMHKIAFGSNRDDVLLLARDDDPGSVSILRLPDGAIQGTFFATRRERHGVDRNTPITDLLSGRATFIEQGVSVDSLLVTADSCTVVAVEGRHIAFPTDDWRAHLWNICGKPQQITTIVKASRTKWVVSADGEFLAGGDEDGGVSIYGLPKGNLIASRVLGPSVRDIAIASDGSWVASAHEGDTALVWDWRSDEILGRAPVETELQSIGAGTNTLFGLSYLNHLQAWDVPGKVDRARLIFRGRLSGVRAALIGDAALAWTDAKETILWRPSNGSVIAEVNAQTETAELNDSGDSALILTNHLYVFSGGQKQLDIELPTEFEEIIDSKGGLSRWIKGEPNPRIFVDSVFDESVPYSVRSVRNENEQRRTFDRKVYWQTKMPPLWPLSSKTGISRTQGSISYVAAIRGDGKEVAVSMLDWVLRYNVESGSRIASIALGYEKEPTDFPEPQFGSTEKFLTVGSMIYDSSGSLWITSGLHGPARLWCWASGELKSVKDRKIVLAAGHSLLFQAKAKSPGLIVYGQDQVARQIQVTGTPSAMSSDGNFIATIDEIKARSVEVIGGYNPDVFSVNLFRNDTRKRSWTKSYTGFKVLRSLFSPNNSLIAMGDEEGTVRVWRVEDGAEVSRVSVKGAITHLSFTHDGKAILLAGAADPRLLQVVPLAAEELGARLCSLVARDLTPVEWREYMEGEPYRSTCFDVRKN